jgi:hypothetical protein
MKKKAYGMEKKDLSSSNYIKNENKKNNVDDNWSSENDNVDSDELLSRLKKKRKDHNKVKRSKRKNYVDKKLLNKNINFECEIDESRSSVLDEEITSSLSSSSSFSSFISSKNSFYIVEILLSTYLIRRDFSECITYFKSPSFLSVSYYLLINNNYFFFLFIFFIYFI